VISLFAVIYYALRSVPPGPGILPLLILMLWFIDAVNHNTWVPMWLLANVYGRLGIRGQRASVAFDGAPDRAKN
jgi:hypothetical protein